MAIILQEALRGLFYAPFCVALARDAFAAEGVEIRFTSSRIYGERPPKVGSFAPNGVHGSVPARVQDCYVNGYDDVRVDGQRIVARIARPALIAAAPGTTFPYLCGPRIAVCRGLRLGECTGHRLMQINVGLLLSGSLLERRGIVESPFIETAPDRQRGVRPSGFYRGLAEDARSLARQSQHRETIRVLTEVAAAFEIAAANLERPKRGE